LNPPAFRVTAYNPGMSKPDLNENAARIARETAARIEQPLPRSVEASQEAWSKGVGKVDARGMALLRATFQAGVETAKASSCR
jgi:hypothetical protein